VSGSAYNTIRALAAMDMGIQLGFLGAEGRRGVTDQRLSARSRLLEHGNVDVSGLLCLPSARPGDCISAPSDGGRKLLTCPRGNVNMANLVARDLEAAARHCARARIVHVTSFLDDVTPAQIARLISRVRELSPRVVISIDPGYVWAEWLTADSDHWHFVQRGTAVATILQQADFIFLNQREFDQLSGRQSGPDDLRVLASRIFERCYPSGGDRRARSAPNLILKRRRGCLIFAGGPERVRGFEGQDAPLPPDLIADDTGAGDAFAAGLLAGLIRGRPDPMRFGAELGTRLAREKLCHLGSAVYPHLRGIARRAFANAPVQHFPSHREVSD
jgi:sugar/nucleoside kinase (ribokinase family)